MDDHSVVTKNSSASTPWLSVIIPIYNAEKYLKKCLDSIAIQSHRNFEVILVDDGSSDSSATICTDYCKKDSRFCYLPKENGGAYQSRIFGAEHANGTYITFCDADDYYTTKNAFQILHRYLRTGQYDAVQFGHEKKYNHMKQKKPCVAAAVSIGREEILANEYPRLLCSYWDNAKITTNVWNKVYHRKLLSNFPSSVSAERIFWGDDQIMNLQLLSTCDTLLFIPDILYGYRQLSGGTGKFSRRIMEDLNHIKQYQLSYLDHYEGEASDKIRYTLFAEAASWFYLHVQQALEFLSEDEVEAMIIETLRLPSFIQAREYYLHECNHRWEAIELLCEADPKEYIAKGKATQNNQTKFDAIRRFLLKVYTSI